MTPDLITFEGTVWCEREGPCVDPFGGAAHMVTGGGWTRRGRETESDPPLMCDACMERLRSLSPVSSEKDTGNQQA